MGRTPVEGICPICGEQASGSQDKYAEEADVVVYKCSRCGCFGLTCSAQSMKYCGDDKPTGVQGLSAERREVLSRAIRMRQDGASIPLLTSFVIWEFIETGMLPETMTSLPATV